MDLTESIQDAELATYRREVRNQMRRAMSYMPGAAVNAELALLGVDPIDPDGVNTYRINIPVKGVLGHTIHAHNRAEAEQAFRQAIATNLEARRLRAQPGHTVYELELTEPDVPVSFHSGPEDPETPEPAGKADAPATMEALKAAVYETAKRLRSQYNLCRDGINKGLDKLGLPELPEEKEYIVTVPVSGTVQMPVVAFDEDSALAAVSARITQGGPDAGVWVKPDELGTATVQAGITGGDGINKGLDEDFGDF